MTRRRRDGQPTADQTPPTEGDEALAIDWAKGTEPRADEAAAQVAERQADAVADSAPPIAPPADTGEKLANGFTRTMALADMEEIHALDEEISRLSMKRAQKFKSIESAGGDKKAFKWAYQLRYGDPAESKARIAALKEYVDWMVQPALDEAAAAGSEG